MRSRPIPRGVLHLFLPELAPRAPWFVARPYEGDFQSFAETAAAFDAAIEARIYWGLQLAVVCPKDVARIREENIARE